MKKTTRGFAFQEFKDRYGAKYSIQKSSLATEDAIWFGIDDPDPQIMAINAIKLGMQVPENTGWVKYPIPKEVLLNTRMHLTIKDVKKILPILQRFVETGELYEQKEDISKDETILYAWGNQKQKTWFITKKAKSVLPKGSRLLFKLICERTEENISTITNFPSEGDVVIETQGEKFKIKKVNWV